MKGGKKMAKLKKIGVWTFGLVLALAFLINQLVQILIGYALQPASSYFQSLAVTGNTLIISIIQWTLIILIPFIVGVVFVLLYNLVSKWVGIKLEITEKKR